MTLTSVQLSIWLADQVAPLSSQASVLHALRLRGNLNRQAVVAAVRKLGHRHPAICLKIDDSSGFPEAVYALPEEIPFEIDTLPATEGVPEEWVHRCLMQAAEKRIDLRRQPAIAVRLLVLSESENVLCFHGHHISLDDVSVSVLLRDFGRFYTQSLSGEENTAAEEFTQALQEAPEFYPVARHTPNPSPRPLPWPGRNLRVHDDIRTAGVNLNYSAILDLDTAIALREVARQQQTTLFCLCAAAYQVLLGRYCLVDDVAVGVGFSLRANQSAMNEVGAWVSVVGIASQVEETRSIGSIAQEFESKLRSIRKGETACDIMGYSASIVRYLAQRALPDMLGLVVEHEPLPADGVMVELATSLREVDEGLKILMRGRVSLFTPNDLQALMEAYSGLLRSLVADGNLAISSGLSLPAPTRKAIAERAVWAAVPGSEIDLSNAFCAIAAKHPKAIALSENGVDVNYDTLLASAQALAGWLISDFGLAQGDRVGMLIPRGSKLAVAHLGALLAGLVIVPIDLAYPDERVELIAENAACKVLLCGDTGIFYRIAHMATRNPALPRYAAMPDLLATSPSIVLPSMPRTAPAYIVYTSGSTGVPKGAIVPRQALVRLALGCFDDRLGPGHRIGQFSSPGFDALFIELWGALLNGATLVCPSKNLVAIADFVDLLRQGGVTHAFLTTTIFNLIVDEDIAAFAGLTKLMVGGEAMSAPHAARMMRRHPSVSLMNVYGPTENGALSTLHLLQSPPADVVISVPIGVPLPGNMAFVLDRYGHPLPDGFLGELWLGGQGLALGYNGNAAATLERFCTFDPIDLGLAAGDGVVLYRTGDRVRWDATGRAIEFHGRIDSQIKFNGFRIEPSEIEVNMMRVAGIRRAAVVAPRTGQGGNVTTIIAVFDSVDAGLDPIALETRLRAELAQTLPRFMLPHRFLFLPDGLPVNASGKIDRKAIEVLVENTRAPRTANAAATGSQVETIWCRVLAVSKTIPDADFFAMGGHSVLAMRLLAELKRELGLTISVADFLAQPTLGFLERAWLQQQKAAIRQKPTGSRYVSLLKSGPEDCAPLFCLPGLMGQSGWVHSALGAMSDMGRAVLGLRLKNDYPPNSIDEIATFLADEILNWHRAHKVKEGPIIAGFSMGGFLAVTVAHALEAAGTPCNKVILIDPNTNLFAPPGPTPITQKGGIAETLVMLRRAHVLRPVNTRLDFVAGKKSFPWQRLNLAGEWAVLARGGIAVHGVDLYHLEFTQKREGAKFARVLTTVSAGERQPEYVLNDPWSDADIGHLSLAAQDSERGAYQDALDHLDKISAARQTLAHVQLQRLRLLEKTKDVASVVHMAQAMLTAAQNTDAVMVMQMMESLDRLANRALANDLEHQVLDPHPDQTSGLLFLRIQRRLNAGDTEFARHLLQHPRMAEMSPIETELMHILVARKAHPCGAESWEDRLITALSHPDAVHVHYGTAMRTILSKGDDEIAEKIIALAERAFPGDPFRQELQGVWNAKVAKWT